MTPEDAEEYTDTIAISGQVWWRQVHLGYRMGAPEALGVSLSEWADRVRGPIRLAAEERREAVKELKDEGLSNREAATVLGVAEGTIRNDTRAAQDYAPEAPTPEEAGQAIAQDYAPDPEAEDEWEPCAACGAAARRLFVHDEDHFGGRVVCQRCAEIEDQAGRRQDEEPTLGELVPPDLALPSGKLTPEQRVAFAIGRLHVGTKYTAADITDAFFEAEAACGDRDFCRRHLEKLDDLLEWLAAIRGGLGGRLSGPRLHAVGTEH